MIGKTNTDRQTNKWIDINNEVKVAVILSKKIFPVANFFMQMFMSLMNLQSIRICQQILQVKLISKCMHSLRAYKTHSQELQKMAM